MKYVIFLSLFVFVSCSQRDSSDTSAISNPGGIADNVVNAEPYARKAGQLKVQVADAKTLVVDFDLELYQSQFGLPTFAKWSTTVVENPLGSKVTSDSQVILDYWEPTNRNFQPQIFYNKDITVQINENSSDITIIYFGFPTTVSVNLDADGLLVKQLKPTGPENDQKAMPQIQ